MMHVSTALPLALSMGAPAHAFCKACAQSTHTAARPVAQQAALEQEQEACIAGGDGFSAAAGAFALMQEAGDVQPVIRWGRAWLEDNGFDRRARDVALTAALAHCDLAGLSPLQHLYSHAAQCTECCLHSATSLLLPHMPVLKDGPGMSLGYGCDVELQQNLWRAAYWLEEHGKDRVQDASALLKEALELLQQYKAAPALQAEVQAAHEVSCMWPAMRIIYALVLADLQSLVGSCRGQKQP